VIFPQKNGIFILEAQQQIFQALKIHMITLIKQHSKNLWDLKKRM
jgi:hypothetical protein